jgi:hypothetical protein
LLRFAHKISKNRRLGDFLPYKLQKHAHKSGFLASLDEKNPQAQQAARHFLRNYPERRISPMKNTKGKKKKIIPLSVLPVLSG